MNRINKQKERQIAISMEKEKIQSEWHMYKNWNGNIDQISFEVKSNIILSLADAIENVILSILIQ